MVALELSVPAGKQISHSDYFLIFQRKPTLGISDMLHLKLKRFAWITYLKKVVPTAAVAAARALRI